jgi:hypothetical protein
MEKREQALVTPQPASKNHRAQSNSKHGLFPIVDLHASAILTAGTLFCNLSFTPHGLFQGKRD